MFESRVVPHFLCPVKNIKSSSSVGFDFFDKVLIIQTPFQCWEIRKIISRQEKQKIFVIYLTRSDSNKDRIEFKKIQEKCTSSTYFFQPDTRYDFVAQFKIFNFLKKSLNGLRCEAVISSSVEDMVISSAIKKINPDFLITVDDGSGNFNTKSVLYFQKKSLKKKVYRLIFRAPKFGDTTNRIHRHYSMRPDLANIIPSERVLPLTCFGRRENCQSTPEKIIFVGAPFQQLYTENEIASLLSFLSTREIDYYLLHPREVDTVLNRERLKIDSENLPEELILELSRVSRVTLIGPPSTVFLTCKNLVSKRLVLSIGGSEKSMEAVRLLQKDECQVVEI